MDDITRTATPTGTDKQATATPLHRLPDETHGTRNGSTADPPQRDEERDEMNKNGRKRTGWDENEHEASSRGRPETACQISETAPETDTMEQTDRPRPRENEASTDQASNRPTDDPTPTHRASPSPVSPHAPPPDTKNGETRKGGTTKRNGKQAERRDAGTAGRQAGREHEKEND